MKIRFWGVRGVFAMTGADYLRYGGNTPAVEFCSECGQRLLVDLGTGVMELAKELMAAEFGQGRGELPILLSHTHLDHLQGLPFFTPFFVKGNRFRIFGAEPAGMPLIEVLQSKLNPHYSPLYGLENLAAGVAVEPVAPGVRLSLGAFAVETALVPHGSNVWSLGFRIEADGKSVAFITDVEYPGGVPTEGALKLAKGADLLIHDAMLSCDDPLPYRSWGHSTPAVAIEVAQRAQVKTVVFFPHHPDATDDVIDALVAEARQHAGLEVCAASEGEPFVL